MNTLNILFALGLQNDLHPNNETLLLNISNKLNNFKGIVFTVNKSYPAGSYNSLLEAKYNANEYCIQLSEGADFIDGIKNALDSSFHWGTLQTVGITSQEIIQKMYEMPLFGSNKIDFHIIGLNTDTMVISTALLLRTYFPNNEITIDASCCSGTSQDKHIAALKTATSNYIHVINSSDVEDIVEVQ